MHRRARRYRCASNWLLRIHAQLSDHTERYRRVRIFHFATPAQVARAVEREHRELLDALLATKVPRRRAPAS